LAGRALRIALISWLLAGLAVAAQAPSGGLQARLGAEFAAALRLAPASGVHVVDLERGATVFARAADTRRILASNTKLVTAAAALELLGPGYQFRTPVLARGAVAGGWLRGDLAVVGGGDPNISGRHHDGDPLAVFRLWAAELRRRGIRRVEGDVYLVHGRFEPPGVHPDWPRDQLDRWYEAPVEALSFSDNSVLVRVAPGPAPGRPARVETVPDLPLFTFDNRAGTTSSRRRHRVAVDRIDGSNRLRVAGAMLRRAAPVESWIAVADPLAYFGAALREALAEERVAVSGEMRPIAELPAGSWRRVAEHRTDLLTTIEVTLKRSQNFYAESLLKTLGAELCGEGSWQAGLEVLAEYLDGIGIPRGGYQLADGSGMSRGNRMSPRQLTWLLGYLHRRPLGRELSRAMSHSGEPETSWERRLAEPLYRGNVVAKTGGLNGVSTLSGYAKARSGRLYAFSILMNGAAERWRAKRAQDRILRALIDLG
jgi:D-alanyl-D-alanine carboxypeptidase/D-alanyl-D-alanine-endopeptidase (penicillin-binding protein 4)